MHRQIVACHCLPGPLHTFNGQSLPVIHTFDLKDSLIKKDEDNGQSLPVLVLLHYSYSFLAVPSPFRPQVHQQFVHQRFRPQVHLTPSLTVSPPRWAAPPLRHPIASSA